MISAGAFARFIETADVVDGYRNCVWEGNKVTFEVGFKKPIEIGNGKSFNSRELLIYAYDRNGVPVQNTRLLINQVALNGSLNGGTDDGNGYTAYYGTKGNWRYTVPFTAQFTFIIASDKVLDWPAISVRAGNMFHDTDVVDVSGAAYIVRDKSRGSCEVVDPQRPPPPNPVTIHITAPDWNLGELPYGDGVKTFTSSAEQLCFDYSAAEVNGKKFVIDAGNANGIVGNRYRMINSADPTQAALYSIELNGGTSLFSLPNSRNEAVTFNSGGRTCFVPTFRTSVGAHLKQGDYHDVLTFTVVTKS